jgi:hypothetical protein
MTRLSLATLIRKKTKQSSTSLTDADLLPMVNDAKNEISQLIEARDIKGNYFIIPATTNLIAGQREYAWADDVLDHLYSIEVAFSNTTDAFGQLPYIQAFPDDFRRLGLSRIEANILANYTNVSGAGLTDAFGSANGRVSGPRYEMQRRAIYLLSGAIDATTLGASTITNGIRVRYRQFPADLPDLTDNTSDISVDPTTTSFGFPKQFQEILARRVSLAWKGDHPGAVPLSPLETRYDADLEAKLSGIEMNDMSGEIIGLIPSDTGYDY